MEKPKLLFIVQNPIQWLCVKEIAKESSAKYNTKIEVYCPPQISDDYKKIAKITEQKIIEDGFKVEKQKTTSALIAFAPYIGMLEGKDIKYKIKYCYGAITTKPNITLTADHQQGFDYFFIHDTYSEDLFSAFAPTVIVPYLYISKVKKPLTGTKKKVVLYMPTYDSPDTSQVLDSLKKLKEKYIIAVKKHHGTESLNNEKDVRSKIESEAQLVFSSKDNINSIFDKVDFVLTDNSGALTDALYAEIPVAIATKNINTGPNNIPSIQKILIDNNVIPYTDDLSTERIEEVIKALCKKDVQKRQIEESRILFPDKWSGVKTWLKAIDSIAKKEYSYSTKLREHLIEDIVVNKNLINQLQAENKELKEELSYYENSRLHRYIKRLHKSLKKI